MVTTKLDEEKWDRRWLKIAEEIALWSKDRSTKVGAVIVDDRNRLVSIGYNGLPRRARDDVEERHERPEKYLWFEHAERNAIYQCPLRPESCTIYITAPPCMDCARGIVQSGILRVVCWGNNDLALRWEDHFKRSKKLFSECWVSFDIYDKD